MWSEILQALDAIPDWVYLGLFGIAIIFWLYGGYCLMTGTGGG